MGIIDMRWAKVAVLVLVCFAVVELTDAAACKGYSKGTFTGDVKDTSSCSQACQKAEGFDRGDFKTCSATQFECACVKVKTGSTDERRSLCKDAECGAAGVIMPSVLATAFMLFAHILLH